MKLTAMVVLAASIGFSVSAEEYTKQYLASETALLEAGDELSRYQQLIVADLEIRHHLRAACMDVIRGADDATLQRATTSVADAARLLGQRVQADALLDEALLGARSLLAEVAARPTVARAVISAKAERNVIRLLDRQAMAEATEIQLLLQRLRALAGTLEEAQTLLIAEQWNARMVESNLEPPDQ
jgi:hypothetical protein